MSTCRRPTSSSTVRARRGTAARTHLWAADLSGRGAGWGARPTCLTVICDSSYQTPTVYQPGGLGNEPPPRPLPRSQKPRGSRSPGGGGHRGEPDRARPGDPYAPHVHVREGAERWHVLVFHLHRREEAPQQGAPGRPAGVPGTRQVGRWQWSLGWTRKDHAVTARPRGVGRPSLPRGSSRHHSGPPSQNARGLCPRGRGQRLAA